MDPAVQVDAWKAKMAAEEAKKEVQNERNAGLDSQTTITHCSSATTFLPEEKTLAAC